MSCGRINGNALQAAKEDFDRALNEAQNNYIDEKCASLNQSEGPSFWKSFKNTFYRQSKISRQIGTIIDDSKNTITNDASKAKTFYEDIFLGKHLSTAKFDENWKKFVEDKISEHNFFKTSTDYMYNNKVTTSEITEAHKQIKGSGKSVDNDGIHPLMLKHCGNQFIIFVIQNI